MEDSDDKASYGHKYEPHFDSRCGPSTSSNITKDDNIRLNLEELVDDATGIQLEQYTEELLNKEAHNFYDLLLAAQQLIWKGPFGGSIEYSEYRISSQAVGRMQHGKVYGLGSQAQTYEGMTSSGSSFALTSHDSSYSQQITALQAELEQIRKSQVDCQVQFQAQIHMQMQAQHNQLLDEMQKMREQLSEKEVATGDDESTDSE
ncbi:hypothetical protein M5K25_008181 [Dendrobium thyrsiflorum]|uniref:Uncharacterized protein n=1 Tax=Dendrobium thyrsiflorum TaxID=117978 RepID=A0ABD0V853_DENTH